MSFSAENGYIPSSFQTLMDEYMAEVNDEFSTTYTSESFVGTGFYKFAYPILQKVQGSEVRTSEIFLKLQQYISLTNERIRRPSVTNEGLLDVFTDEGYIASIKPMIADDAGKINVCVDVDDQADDYAATKLEIATILKNSTVAGTVTQGDESETIVLTNGQSFDFKFHLPDSVDVLLRLTLTLSENNQVVIKTDEEVKEILLGNIASKYRLGKKFEPQRYFGIVDAPWCSVVLLEYSVDDGENWLSSVFDANFDDKFNCLLANTSVVYT
jgi:hypothetical protein